MNMFNNPKGRDPLCSLHLKLLLNSSYWQPKAQMDVIIFFRFSFFVFYLPVCREKQEGEDLLLLCGEQRPDGDDERRSVCPRGWVHLIFALVRKGVSAHQIEFNCNDKRGDLITKKAAQFNHKPVCCLAGLYMRRLKPLCELWSQDRIILLYTKIRCGETARLTVIWGLKKDPSTSSCRAP